MASSTRKFFRAVGKRREVGRREGGEVEVRDAGNFKLSGRAGDKVGGSGRQGRGSCSNKKKFISRCAKNFYVSRRRWGSVEFIISRRPIM